MRVLVTGAGGFIGSHVVRALLDRGDAVHAVVRPGPVVSRLEEVRERIDLVSCDLLDPELPEHLDRISPDVCIHLAWFTDPTWYLGDVEGNLRSLEASVRLLRLLARLPQARVVLAGTCLEEAGGPPGANLYPTCKKALHGLSDELRQIGHSTVCAHIFYLYGPHEHEARLIPTIIRRLLRQEEAHVIDGSYARDYLHVEDVASALCAVAGGGVQGTIDICSG
ncbi:MAG: NAD-dependent epimerase/dehydratase family protein, partial [Actinomycetota bacterium]